MELVNRLKARGQEARRLSVDGVYKDISSVPAAERPHGFRLIVYRAAERDNVGDLDET